MKNEIESLAQSLVSTNNLEKLKINKKEILEFLTSNVHRENKITKYFAPIIEEDYSKLLLVLEDNNDANIEKERLKILSVLITISTLFK